jgi:dephospho-CoA kinase
MIVIGLTGSIAMGKSTTAAMFRDEGVPVLEADDVVHRLYAGRASPLIEAAFPGTVFKGVVDRQQLSKIVLSDPAALQRLEAIIHPLVRMEQEAFLAEARRSGAKSAVLDIPLLFETNGRDRVDVVVVVSAPADVQRARVLARPGMTEQKLAAILDRQMPDDEKRALADAVIDTSLGIDHARGQVRDFLASLSTTAGSPQHPQA